jgi:hypothetical protein
MSSVFVKKISVILKNDKYLIKSSESQAMYSLDFLDFVCDLANLFNNNKILEQFSSTPKDVLFNNLTLLCRETSAYLLSEIFSESGKGFDDLISVCSDAHSMIQLYFQSIHNGDVDLSDFNIRIPKSELSYTLVDGAFCETHSFTDIRFLLCYDFFRCIQQIKTGSYLLIKKCENPECGKYFVVKGRSNKIYCDYPAPQNPKLKCSDKQLIRFYGLTDFEIEVEKLYNSNYIAAQRSDKKKHLTGEKSALEKFKRKNAEFKESVKTGNRTMTDYHEWLQNCKFD